MDPAIGELIRQGGGYLLAAIFLIGMGVLWRELARERLRNDELNEKRISQLQASLDSVTKATATLDRAIEAVTRSRA